jgi:hypothetical protein
MNLLTIRVGHRITVSYPKGRTWIVSQNRALKISALKAEGIVGQWRKLESFMFQFFISYLHYYCDLINSLSEQSAENICT